MKKIALIVLSGILLSTASCIEENKVPQKVKDSFAKKFPTASSVEWDKESDTEWEAEFKMNGKEYSSNFTEDGAWTETEYEVTKPEIPQIVLNALTSNFEGYDIEEIELSETAEGVVYEFAIEKGDSEMEVAIDPQGNIVKKEQKKDEDGNDEEDGN